MSMPGALVFNAEPLAPWIRWIRVIQGVSKRAFSSHRVRKFPQRSVAHELCAPYSSRLWDGTSVAIKYARNQANECAQQFITQPGFQTCRHLL